MLDDPVTRGGPVSSDDDDAAERKLMAERRRRLDEALERALEDSFPASDPPGVTQPPRSPFDKDQP